MILVIGRSADFVGSEEITAPNTAKFGEYMLIISVRENDGTRRTITGYLDDDMLPAGTTVKDSEIPQTITFPASPSTGRERAAITGKINKIIGYR